MEEALVQGSPSSPGSKAVTKAAGPSRSVAKGKRKPSAKEQIRHPNRLAAIDKDMKRLIDYPGQ